MLLLFGQSHEHTVLAVVEAQIAGPSFYQGVVAAYDAVKQTNGPHVGRIGDAARAGFLFLHFGLLSIHIEFKLFSGELSRG